MDFVEQSQVMIFEKNLDHSFEKVYSQKKIKFQLAKFNSKKKRRFSIKAPMMKLSSASETRISRISVTASYGWW